MKIFITGATGYVGTRLVPELLKYNHDITCLLRKPESHAKNTILKQCKIIKGDITDRESLRHLLDNMEVVIHLGVSTPLTNKMDDYAIYRSINVLGTKNILEECLASKPKRILCFSSTAAIGMPPVKCIDEETHLQPINRYGQSKKEAEELIFSYVQKYQLPILTICFPHIYGPGDINDFFLIIKLLKKGILPQIGFKANLLPLVYISDAIDAILLALTKGREGEKYIIADDDPHDIRNIRKLVWYAFGLNRTYYPFIPKYLGIIGAYMIERFFAIIGSTPPVTVNNIKSIAAGRRISIEKAKRELDFAPKTNIEQGIQTSIDWYKKVKLL
ncbi:MAG: NAD(P)-dependent oxidoreductase [Deltaproteobacteria bacterium]|nr:NAD(P)-dependent oxidoreductase [Deltaproteobacteria bacterium]